MEQNVILRMEGIKKSFGVVKALKNAQLELRKGEIHALMGENGAGKSTLMNILSGSLKPDEGKIIYMGKEVHVDTPIEARHLGIGKIHQELQLVPELSVGENIFLGREPRTKLGTVNYKKIFAETKDIIAELSLEVDPTIQVKELRVGEKQLIEIAKVTSLNCQVIVMDEPTSALSKSESHRLFEVARSLKEKGVSIIYITHRMEEVFEITDRITVMRDGEYIDTVDTCDTTKDQLIRMMVGRSIRDVSHNVDAGTEEEILRVEHLSLQFPPHYKKTSLKDISFQLHRGEVLGIAGLLGAGRTELMECLFGLHAKIMSGQIIINGQPVTIHSPNDAIRHKIAFLTEDRKGQGLVLTRSIGENMSLPIIKQLSPRMVMRPKEERLLWDKQMEEIRIKAPTYHTLVSALSGGNQQKVVIGRWLLTNPEILLLDEPTRGIDVGARGEIYKLIGELAQQGKGILVVSSELPELLSICDRMLTFCEGRLTGEFSREEANQEVLLSAATLSEEEQYAEA